ncbi:BrnA antitoxin family protein [Candidatus Gottesmanbacteria bacterium]|nr:BrnA antitoxin family protein [Candidatus Gottesmanbacteria bacterium]
MKKFKPIPRFKTEDEERKFWATHDSTEYIDWSKAQRVSFPNLKRTNFTPPTRVISLRLPEPLIAQVRHIADNADVPYQSLIKIFLAQRVKEELSKKRGGTTFIKRPS